MPEFDLADDVVKSFVVDSECKAMLEVIKKLEISFALTQ